MRIGDYQKQSRQCTKPLKAPSLSGFGCSKSYRFPQDEGNGFARLEVGCRWHLQSSSHVFAQVFQRIGHLSISLEKLHTSDQDVQVALKTSNMIYLT